MNVSLSRCGYFHDLRHKNGRSHEDDIRWYGLINKPREKTSHHFKWTISLFRLGEQGSPLCWFCYQAQTHSAMFCKVSQETGRLAK